MQIITNRIKQILVCPNLPQRHHARDIVNMQERFPIVPAAVTAATEKILDHFSLWACLYIRICCFVEVNISTTSS